MLHGQGEYKIDQGSYNGEFVNSLEHGRGLRVYENGATYYGFWLEGLQHGKGVYKDPLQ